MKELVIPPAAMKDVNSAELLRAWVADGAQWVSLNPHLYRDRDFKEEWAWGIFLADTIRHVSNAISSYTGEEREEIVEKICEAFEKEMSKATSEIKGGYVD